MNPAAPRERRLTFRSGGWVLLLALLLSLSAVAWQVAPILLHPRSRAIGDGIHRESYGFPLQPSLVPLDTVVGAGIPRDGLPALDHPEAMTAAEEEAFERAIRGRFLVGEDLVVGVALGGEARAYPLRVLNWHEVANDELGGVPIAVTYGPLCDAAVVLDRRSGGRTMRFGVSGLLYQSCPLIYDRTDGQPAPSLWAPLLQKAVIGPAAAEGRRLRLLPSAVTTWEDWRSLHPETTVLVPDRAKLKRYRRNPYQSYRGSDLLRAPVDPLPAGGAWPLKTPLLVVWTQAGPRPLPLPWLAEKTGGGGRYVLDDGGRRIPIEVRRRPLSAWIAPGAESPAPSVRCFWFAWFATHPGARIALP
ncbi:MAG: DUF3179 domain-containing protein [Acidobacteria bacterium]|nr:MAG: DUF3179 domain-containing protein [Acidobacteriota bacterium]